MKPGRPDFPALTPEPGDCPSCGKDGLRAFYDLAGVPINSCILIDSRAEALAWPCGTLRLSHCRVCGFVTNSRFDASLEYSDRYEETQGFSSTFNAFARELAQRLVQQWGVGNKTVLEIGCGKGEFLRAICAAGGNRGLGIDPAYRPDRIAPTATVRFLAGRYEPRHLAPEVDVIICRHTLEHIASVREMVQGLRRDIGERRDVLLFFEVPDLLRQLRQGAFWDLYHEHCSYFTPGSLARLFRTAGFDVLDLWLDYGAQYVMLVARPSNRSPSPALALEDDLVAGAVAVRDFATRCSARISQWQGEIDAAMQENQPTVLWGSGSKATAFITTLGGLPGVDWVVDINPHKQGKLMPGCGQEIVAPDRLRERPPGLVVLMNAIYQAEVQQDLDRMGIRARLVAV